MKKEIYTKQELVEKAIANGHALIDFELEINGYCNSGIYFTNATQCLDSLYYLKIISREEWVSLRQSMYDYWNERNELSAKMDGEL